MGEVLQQFAEHVARDYFRKSPDSLGWIYIPCRITRKTVIPDEVWQIQFIRMGTNGDVLRRYGELTLLCSPKVTHPSRQLHASMRREGSLAARQIERQFACLTGELTGVKVLPGMHLLGNEFLRAFGG